MAAAGKTMELTSNSLLSDKQCFDGICEKCAATMVCSSFFRPAKIAKQVYQAADDDKLAAMRRRQRNLLTRNTGNAVSRRGVSLTHLDKSGFSRTLELTWRFFLCSMNISDPTAQYGVMRPQTATPVATAMYCT